MTSRSNFAVRFCFLLLLLGWFTKPAHAQSDTSSCVDNLLIYSPSHENFESFPNEGAISRFSDEWLIYPGSTGEAFLSESPMGTGLALRLTGGSNVLYNLDLPFQPRYRLSWRMLVPEGSQASYNVQYAAQAPYEAFAYQVSFDSTGLGNVFLGVGMEPLFSFSYVPGQPTKVVQIISVEGLVELFINDTFVGTWNYADGFSNDFPTNLIGSINFRKNPNSSDSYVDDICVYSPVGRPNCSGLEDLVQLTNGTGRVLTRCAASVELYSESEWQLPVLPTICDQGGPLIGRDQVVSGEITDSEPAPQGFENDPMVRAAFDSIPISNGLAADIYTFYNEPGGQILVEVNSLSQQTIGFVMTCDFSQPEASVQRVLGTFEDFNTDTTLAEGIYYFVVARPLSGPRSNLNLYSFTIFPSGFCIDPAEPVPFCGTKQTFNLANEFDDFSVDANYANCYNGNRTYKGPDKVFVINESNTDASQLQLTDLVLKTQGTQKLGLFLYGDICGLTCLDYVEIDSGETEVVLPIPRGADGRINNTYFLIVDSAPNGASLQFTLESSCAIPQGNANRTGAFLFEQPDCTYPSNFNGHTVVVRDNAFNFQQGDFLFFTYENESGDETVVPLDVAQRYLPVIPFGQIDLLLPPDDTGIIKCSYAEGDTLRMLLLREWGPSNETLYRFEIDYDDPNPPAITAREVFRIDSLSSVSGLTSSTSVNFNLTNSGTINVNASSGDFTFPLITNVSWKTEYEAAQSWFSVSPNAGVGPAHIDVAVAPNPTPFPRQTTIYVQSINADPVVRDSIVLTQRGTCVSSAQNQTFPFTECARDQVSLGSELALYDTAFFNFRWNRRVGNVITLVAEGKVPTIDITAETSVQYIARVEDPTCGGFFEATYSISVPELPTTGPPTTESYCYNENLPTLSEPGFPNVTWDWFDAADNQVASGVAAFLPLTGGTYYSRARRMDSPSCTATQVNIYTVSPTPIINLSISAPGTVCSGETASLTATATGGVGAPLTYQWSNDLGVNPTATTPPLTTVTSYSVSVTDPTGCAVDTSFTIGVTAVSPALDVTTSCSASLQTYTVELTTGVDQVIASNGTVSAIAPNRFRIADIPIQQTLNVDLNDTANGCTLAQSISPPDCSCPAVAAPTPTEAQPISYCPGQVIPALGAVAPDGAIIDWYDAPSGGMLLAQGTNSFQPFVPGNYYAEARIGVSGCTSAGRTQLSVQPLPAPMAAAGTDQVICQGDTVQLDASGSTGVDSLHYQWTTQSGSAVGTTASISVQPMVDTDYDLLVTDGNSCQDQVSVRVNVGPPLAGTVVITSPILCEGDTNGALEVLPAGGTPAFDVLWSNGNPTSGLSNLGPGTYAVTVTDQSNCRFQDAVTLTAPDPLGFDSVFTNPASMEASMDGSVDLILAGGTPPYRLSWTSTDGMLTDSLPGIDSLARIDNLPADNYQLDIVLEDANGCTLSTAVSFVVVSTPEVEWPAAIKVYPNPVEEELYIEFSDWFDREARFRLINSFGQIVEQQQTSSKRMRWDMSHLPPGLYVIQLEQAGRRPVYRLLKL